jgi:hypothetical protein
VGGACSVNGGKEMHIGYWLMDNIRMNLVEVGWGDVDWIGLAQVESSCEFGIEPSGSIKCWETIKWLHNWWPFE